MNAFLDADALHIACRGGLWGDVQVVDSTGSTNADLADAARAGAPAGVVLVSGHQSAGRGRLTRRWEAPPNTSVAVSVLVAPARPVADWGWLPLVVGMAVVDGVRAASGLEAGLKWPNDVLVDGRKLCGILCETVLTDAGPRAVLGFGINVSLAEEDLPVPTATSVRLAGSGASATEITAASLAALENLFGRWEAGDDLTADYRAKSVTLGKDVSAAVGDTVWEGRALDIDATGALKLATASGPRTVVAGDVTHLR
ncbi:biotin--[acetyl-CoA-carboxylase] ligase [Propioniciclava sp.]|uniref:biotin--[acetyl-CoA-carboxylase] ligase n=1 Tax=Propioniciclava sp. TaxID=2038686 RepID=UPI0026099B54|nr:biotin--[acetyl-CoA-carboxylase] ligase [Propioniciclava sp.]